MTLPDLPDILTRPQQAAVASAGYRVARWAAAREVLQTRVAKGRVSGELGAFLTKWMSPAPAVILEGDFELSFTATPGQIGLTGGSLAFVASSLEQALLHLPALRSFWRNELRQAHFDALKAIVPPAWLRDETSVPPGAVIHGLGITTWERLERASSGWEWHNQVLTLHGIPGAKINARYGRNDKHQVILRSAKELLP